MTVLYITAGILLTILLYIIFNLLKKVEAYEDKIKQYEDTITLQEEYIVRVSNLITESRELIKQIDSRGIFEADDEVGTFFRFLQEIQDALSNYIITETNGKSKE